MGGRPEGWLPRGRFKPSSGSPRGLIGRHVVSDQSGIGGGSGQPGVAGFVASG